MADESKKGGATAARGDASPEEQRRPLTVEVGGGQNQNLLWGPTAARLRGRWDGHNLAGGDQSEAGLRKMPTIPGVHVVIDPRARKCRLVDPLSLPANRGLLQQVNTVFRHLFRRDTDAVPEYALDNATDDQLATWLYWAMRLVQGENGRVVSGECPRDERAIAALYPGAKIEKKFFDYAEDVRRTEVRESVAAGFGV